LPKSGLFHGPSFIVENENLAFPPYIFVTLLLRALIHMKFRTLFSSNGWNRITSPMAVVAVILFVSTYALSAAQVGVQMLPGSVPQIVSCLQPVEELAASKRLDLVVALPLRNQSALTNLLREICDPHSPNYHRYLNPAQFAEQFSPAENDYQTIRAFAASNGLAITGTHANRTLLDVNGPVSTIEKVFHVHLHTYHHPTEARLFYAPDAAPSLNLSLPVLNISGLDNFTLPRPMNILTNFFDQPLNAIPYATGSGPRGNFIGKDFRAAYAPAVTLDGSGQAIGLFELDGYYPGDIATYESLAGLSPVALTNVVIDGFSGPPGANNVEVALDIEMAVAMAPGLSKVIVYEGSTGNDILNRMATDDSARQLSCSWAFGSAVDTAREQIFEQFAAQGQSFFQASGDDGGGEIVPPSDDPFVTVVGGTSLTTGTNGAWQSETTWPDSAGGISANYAIPVWQQGVNMTANQGSTTMRNIPDVACLADTVIWLVANNGVQGVVGGTSASAPLWAGFAALINQQAAANNQSSIGFANPAIYALGQSSNGSSAFHDITTGNNTNSSSPDKFFAVPGYDLCTGWGTPDGTNLINALRPPADVLQITPQTSVAFVGSVGGSFSPAAQNFYIINQGTNALNWSLGNTSVWFNAAPANGSLPAGETATVTIAPTALVNDLAAGQYTATLFFADLNDGVSVNRQIVLNIINPVETATGVVFSNLYSFSGGNDGANPNGLMQSTNGIFYGTTQNGGSNTVGTVFQMTNGLVSNLYSFTGDADGANPFTPLAQGPDGNFYGTTFQGGDDGNGTIFNIAPEGGLTTLVTFDITNGDLPFAGLTLGTDGNFYGTTYQGGASGSGTAFRTTTNGVFTTLYSFTNGNDGGYVAAGLIQGADGNFYGATRKGGVYAEGAVFELSTNGTVTTLFSLDDTNGAFPSAGLAQDVAGNFYGVASQGGAYGNGTVFKITATGQLTNLYSFTGGNDGANPQAALLLGPDGNFYGTTANGGTNGDGTVFVVSPDGILTPLIEFNGLNGANPQAALIRGNDGYLYGATQNGGVAGAGGIFRLAIDSKPQITAQPASQSVFAGANVQFGVSVLGSAPLFYQWQKDETNLTDGGNATGSTNRILDLSNVTTNDTGIYSVIVSNALGWIASSNASLIVTSSLPIIVSEPQSETLTAGATAVFTVTAQGNAPLLYQWQENTTNLVDGGAISGSATSTLTISNVTAVNAGIYAVAISNALGSVTSSNANLTVLSASTNGTSVATLHWFNNDLSDGDEWPPNGLMLAHNGVLYGTTQFGSTSNVIGQGTIFTIDTNGQYSTLNSFTYPNGNIPLAPLVEDTNGNFYGTTEFGGANNIGNIFKLTPDDTLTNFYSFAGNDNYSLAAPLILGTNGDLYGVTSAGGDNSLGNIFVINPDGDFTNLYSFTGAADGASPVGALLQANDGNFYGLTGGGGADGHGTIFKMTPAGALTVLYTFTGGTDGYDPVGALVQGADGYLYGATEFNTIERFQFYGTLFKISTNGAFSTLYSLNDPDGAYPRAGLIQGSDGNFYGTTFTGAYDTNGTLFRITAAGTLTTLVAFDGINDGRHPESALVEGVDGALYGTTTTNGPGGRGTIFRLSFTSAPQVTTQPANQTVAVGATVSFSVAVDAAPPRYYQWQKNNTNLPDIGSLFGATNRILTLTNVSVADGGSYTVIVSNSLGTVTSSNALLTVIASPIATITQSNGIITLTWSANAGQTYQLQYTTGLSSPAWINLGNAITATNNAVITTDVIGANTQRFYRVMLSP
jgi:uncharacterized repeat protein (TIGR03803 family)